MCATCQAQTRAHPNPRDLPRGPLTERRTIACGERVNAECVRYLNRLSDLLFILSRAANAQAKAPEPLWEPGRYR